MPSCLLALLHTPHCEQASWLTARPALLSGSSAVAAIAQAEVHAGEFKAQELANLTWGVARAASAYDPHPAAVSTGALPAVTTPVASLLFAAVAAPAAERIRAGEFKPQELASLTLAFARAGHGHHVDVFRAVESQALPR